MKQFPIVIFHQEKVLRLLYSCAFARVAAADAQIVIEPTVFNIPGFSPMRVGGVTENDPKALKFAALEIFHKYLSGYTASLGNGDTLVFLNKLIMQRENFRARLQAMHEYCMLSNERLDNNLSAAFDATITVRAVCTVALATGATVATLTASAAAVPAALIFLGYKAANTYAVDLSKLLDAKTNYGFAIYKEENGVRSLGEGTQEVVNRTFSNTAYRFRNYLAEELKKNKKIIVELEKSIEENAQSLLAAIKKLGDSKNLSSSLRKVIPTLASQISQDRAKLAAARSAAASTSTSGAVTRTLTGRVVPIVFLANDVISAYNEWYDSSNEFHAMDPKKAH